MDKALNYLSIARKAGLVELGEEPVAGAARAQRGVLVVVAGDASDHTWRRAKSLVAGTKQQCLRLPYTKDEMGMAVGRVSLAVAAVTDPALALSLVQSLESTEQVRQAENALQEMTQRRRQRAKEAKAHQRNVRTGGKKPTLPGKRNG